MVPAGMWKRYGLLYCHEDVMKAIKPQQVGASCAARSAQSMPSILRCSLARCRRQMHYCTACHESEVNWFRASYAQLPHSCTSPPHPTKPPTLSTPMSNPTQPQIPIHAHTPPPPACR